MQDADVSGQESGTEAQQKEASEEAEADESAAVAEEGKPAEESGEKACEADEKGEASCGHNGQGCDESRDKEDRHCHEGKERGHCHRELEKAREELALLKKSRRSSSASGMP